MGAYTIYSKNQRHFTHITEKSNKNNFYYTEIRKKKTQNEPYVTGLVQC